MTYEKAFAALADPTRRQVFEALATAPRSVSEIAGQMPVSRPAVSQHLKVLSDAGLVSAQAKGRSRIYSLDPAGLACLRAYLDGFWEAALARFAQEVETQASAQTSAEASAQDAAQVAPLVEAPGSQPPNPSADPLGKAIIESSSS